jgi:CBS-domain-containing membrane protein
MQRHHVGALPVLDGGRVVGILTRGDLLGALVSALTVRSLRRPGAGASRTPASPPAALPCHDAESGLAGTGAAGAQARE